MSITPNDREQLKTLFSSYEEQSKHLETAAKELRMVADEIYGRFLELERATFQLRLRLQTIAFWDGREKPEGWTGTSSPRPKPTITETEV